MLTILIVVIIVVITTYLLIKKLSKENYPQDISNLSQDVLKYNILSQMDNLKDLNEFSLTNKENKRLVYEFVMNRYRLPLSKLNQMIYFVPNIPEEMEGEIKEARIFICNLVLKALFQILSILDVEFIEPIQSGFMVLIGTGNIFLNKMLSTAYKALDNSPKKVGLLIDEDYGLIRVVQDASDEKKEDIQIYNQIKQILINLNASLNDFVNLLPENVQIEVNGNSQLLVYPGSVGLTLSRLYKILGPNKGFKEVLYKPFKEEEEEKEDL